MERPKPPNYVSSQSSALEPPKQKKKGKSKKKQSERLDNRSPSPFSSIRKSHFETLNQSSIEGVGVSQTQQNLLPYSQTVEKDEDVRSRSSRSKSNRSRSNNSQKKRKTKKDLKHILESNTAVIDQIFQKRTRQIEKAKKQEEDKKAAEDAEFKEVMEANQSLKDSLQGKSQSSKNTLKQLSGDPTMKTMSTHDDKSSTGKPVDTAKEFLSTIND